MHLYLAYAEFAGLSRYLPLQLSSKLISRLIYYSLAVSVQCSTVLGFPVIQFSPFMSLCCTQLYLLAFNWTLSRCLCTPVVSTRLPFNSVLSLSLSLSYSAVLIRHLIYPLFFSFSISNVFSCITLPKYG
jgi:hypothetical protein